MEVVVQILVADRDADSNDRTSSMSRHAVEHGIRNRLHRLDFRLTDLHNKLFMSVENVCSNLSICCTFIRKL